MYHKDLTQNSEDFYRCSAYKNLVSEVFLRKIVESLEFLEKPKVFVGFLFEEYVRFLKKNSIFFEASDFVDMLL